MPCGRSPGAINDLILRVGSEERERRKNDSVEVPGGIRPAASTVSGVSRPDTQRIVMTDQTARRGQAVAGVLTAAVVFAMLIAAFFLVRSGDDDAGNAAPAARTASAAVDPLTVEPEVAAGSGTLEKLTIKELIPGAGAAVKAGQTIKVNYKLVSYSTGEVIDSSWTGRAPFTTQIGTGQLIQGWDQGIPGQKVGSRIQLDVPADLAYGPEKGDLRFVVDILDAQ
jgi:hypothetical protein